MTQPSSLTSCVGADAAPPSPEYASTMSRTWPVKSLRHSAATLLLAPDRLAEFRTRLPAVAFAYLCIVLVIFFIELQSFVLQGMFDLT